MRPPFGQRGLETHAREWGKKKKTEKEFQKVIKKMK